MRISNLENVTQIYNKSVKSNLNKTEKIDKKDKIEISSEARDFQTAIEKLKELPDIREEKIQDIKQRILDGSYQVDSKKIADKILSGSRLIEKYNEW